MSSINRFSVLDSDAPLSVLDPSTQVPLEAQSALSAELSTPPNSPDGDTTMASPRTYRSALMEPAPEANEELSVADGKKRAREPDSLTPTPTSDKTRRLTRTGRIPKRTAAPTPLDLSPSDPTPGTSISPAATTSSHLVPTNGSTMPDQPTTSGSNAAQLDDTTPGTDAVTPRSPRLTMLTFGSNNNGATAPTPTHSMNNSITSNPLSTVAPVSVPLTGPGGHALNGSTATYPATLSIMPVPPGGFPEIHGLTEKTLYAHVHRDSRDIWRAQTTPGLIVYIAHGRPVRDGTHQVTLIKELLTSVLVNCPNLVVGHARPLPCLQTNPKPPFPYYVGGISEAQVSSLISRGCWSSPTITVFAHPLSPRITPFVASLINIPLEPSDTNNAKVAAAIRTRLESEPAVHNLIARYRDNLPPFFSHQDALLAIYDSVSVTSYSIAERGTERTLSIFNMFVKPPTIIPDRHDQWVTKLRSLAYVLLEGAADIRDPFKCACCKSADHPSGLCPFPKLPGWHDSSLTFAPPPATNAGTADTGGRFVLA